MLSLRSSLYWGFFSPSYLFFTGGGDLVGSTRQAGVFLGLTAIPLVAGIYQIVTARWPDPLWRVMLCGFALAPLAASTFSEPGAAGRALGALPFGVLVSAAGVQYLFGHRLRVMRLSLVCVLLLLPVQFYRFYHDYFAAYPHRSSAAFGGGVARE